MEGSVDEESTKSDEEYEDLAMRDGLEDGYWSDDEDESTKQLLGNSAGAKTDKYWHNLGLVLKSSDELDHPSEPLFSYSSLITETNQGGMAHSDGRIKKRSLSDPRFFERSQIAALGKHDSLFNGPILSGAPQR